MKQSAVRQPKRGAKVNAATSAVSPKMPDAAKPGSSVAEEPTGDWDALMHSMDRRLDMIHARLDALIEYQARRRA